MIVVFLKELCKKKRFLHFIQQYGSVGHKQITK